LGKRNDVYEAPRRILKHIPGVKVVEMKRQRDNGLCCGGGGGRVWIDVEEISRLSESRVREALDAGADTLSTACPWCHIQLEDGVKTAGCEGRVDVREVAELLAESLG
jgi:Fe-S oxidoreductase